MPLRSLEMQDLPLVRAWRNQPRVRLSMYSQHLISETEHREWFLKLQQDPSSFWYIYESENLKPEGVVYFTRHDVTHRNAFWGFYTGDEAPKGTGRIMGLCALEKAFTDLNLHKLNADVLATNSVSLKYHKRMGFQLEGRLRETYLDDQSYLDVIRFGILKSEWLALHKSPNSTLNS